ncbi:MAG: hypothetical protein JWP35_950 [Caulobacter sp.]|nr:hypothetical protein [Caulobacter sp.]
MSYSIQPNTEDRETGPFFAAAAEGRLVFRVCNDCGHATQPPTEHCPWCGGWNTEWRQAQGRGRLHTWTTVTHQIHPDYPTPFTLVVVELDETPDVRLMGRLDGAPVLTAGQPMEVWFEKLNDDVALPQWRPLGRPV